MKKFVLKLIIPLIIIGIIGCSKDIVTPTNNSNSPSFSTLSMTGDVSFVIESEMTMNTRITPMAGNNGCVSEAENQLRFKKSMDCLLYMMVKNNGNIDADIQMADFSNKPVYPQNMIGCPTIDVAYMIDRIEIRDGVSTIYNKEGEIITTGFQSDSEFYQSIVENINQGINSKFTTNDWDVVKQAMIDANYEIVNRQSQRDELSFAMQRSDGGKTEISFDKELSVISGNRNYNSQGILTSANKTLFNDNQSNKWEERIKSQIFVVPYKSPFVDCEMAIVKSVDYKSFDVKYQ